METYRRSHVIGPRPGDLNTSQMTTSNYENRTKYESAQTDLLVILKWVILVIGILILLLFLKATFISNCEQSTCISNEKSYFVQFKDWIVSFFTLKWFSWFGSSSSNRSTANKMDYVSTHDLTEPSKVVKYTRTEINERSTKKEDEDNESLWSNWLPDQNCKGWKELQEKLKNQKFSVKPFLVELPSLEKIKSGSDSRGYSDLQQKSINEIKSKYPVDNFFSEISRLTNGRPDDSNGFITNANEKLKNAERNLDNIDKGDLRLKLADLMGSQKALLNKRKQIADLQQKLSNSLNQLNDCENEENQAMNSIENERQKLRDLQADLKRLEDDDQLIKSKLDEKEKKLNEADRRNREELLALQNRELQLRNEVSRVPKYEKEIDERLKNVSKLEAELSGLGEYYNNIQRKRNELQSKIDNFGDEKDKLAQELKLLQAQISSKKTIITAYISRERIKQMLQNIIPAVNQTKALEEILNGNIKEEDEILQKLKSYSEFSSEEQELQDYFENERNSLKVLIKAQLDLQKTIKEYTPHDIDIHLVRKSFDALVEQEAALRKRLSQLTAEYEAAKNELARLQSGVDNRSAREAELRRQIDADKEWCMNKRNEMRNLENELKRVQGDIRMMENEQKEYKRSIASNFGDLDLQRSALKEKMFAIRSAINDMNPKLSSIEMQLNKKKSECSALKGFYLKTAELLPSLKASFDADNHILFELRQSVKNYVDLFLDL